MQGWKEHMIKPLCGTSCTHSNRVCSVKLKIMSGSCPSLKCWLFEFSFGTLSATSHLFNQVMNQCGKQEEWSWTTSSKRILARFRGIVRCTRAQSSRGIINESDWFSWLADIWKLMSPRVGLVVPIFSTVPSEFTDMILFVVSILQDNLLYFIFHGLECVIIQWSVPGFGSHQCISEFLKVQTEFIQ